MIERTYKADIADVWALWTTKDGFTRMSVEGFTSQLTKLDKRFGADAQ